MRQKKSKFESCLMLGFLALGLSITFANPAARAAIPLQLGLSPDNSRELLFSAIKAARSEIAINIYQFDRKDLTDLLISKMQSGLTLRILIEGEPVGKISSGGKRTISTLLNAMNNHPSEKNHLYLMTKDGSNAKRRFAFNHAKYVVIDRTTTYISSENFTGSGTPDAGTIGNRGWQTVISDRNFAKQMSDLFSEDTSLEYGDVQDLTVAGWGDEDDHFVSLGDNHSTAASRPVAAIAMATGQASSVELITAPKAVEPLVNLMSEARQTLRLEQMSIPKDWKYPTTQTSPWIATALKATKRGVQVQVLMNDENSFGSSDETPDNETALKPNQVTANFLNQIAYCESLPLEARIVDTRAVGITYIHNKGIIIDSSTAVVSSINGTQNSAMNNREVAVALRSPDAANYFTKAFGFDWKSSESKNHFRPSPCNALESSLNNPTRWLAAALGF